MSILKHGENNHRQATGNTCVIWLAVDQFCRALSGLVWLVLNMKDCMNVDPIHGIPVHARLYVGAARGLGPGVS